jgi:hypothetical protein
VDETRFRKILGLLGSAHDGERSAAALKATAMLREGGKTWADVEVGATAAGRGEAIAAQANADLWRRLLDDERTRTTDLSNQLLAAQREIARLMGKSMAGPVPKKPAPRTVDVEEDALRRNVREVLDEHEAGDLEISAKSLEFLESLGSRRTWTEAQRSAVERTLKWVNAGRRAA